VHISPAPIGRPECDHIAQGRRLKGVDGRSAAHEQLRPTDGSSALDEWLRDRNQRFATLYLHNVRPLAHLPPPMNPTEWAKYIADNWQALIGASIVVAPLTFLFFRWVNANRLEELQAQVRMLREPAHSDSSGTLVPQTNTPADVRRTAGSDPRLISAPVAAAALAPSLVFARTNDESERDLIKRLEGASKRINVFGLTRNFYARDSIRPLLIRKAYEVPVVLYMMEPDCASRADRYRIEPTEAALEDPHRFIREVLGSLQALTTKVPATEAASTRPGLAVYLYNFPCSFAIEEIDDSYRIMLYGPFKRGTDSPILIFPGGTSISTYFSEQLRLVERLASETAFLPWSERGIVVRNALNRNVQTLTT